MNIDLWFTEIWGVIAPFFVLGGAIAFTIAMICMLINMLINASTGRGFKL